MNEKELEKRLFDFITMTLAMSVDQVVPLDFAKRYLFSHPELVRQYHEKEIRLREVKKIVKQEYENR